VLVRRLIWASRIEAQLAATEKMPEALAAATRAVEACEKLLGEERASSAEIGEAAAAYVVLGEVVQRSGDPATARRHWEHAAELLAPKIIGTRDWRLLDPAARAALHLNRSAMATAIIGQLDRLGYVPFEPWPETNRLDDDKP
jgi:hypothetical protein